MTRLLIAVSMLLVTLGVTGGTSAAEKIPFNIGYLEIEDDERYEAPRAYAGIETRPRHRPVAGANIAIRDSKFKARALGLKLNLVHRSADDVDGLLAALDALVAEDDARFVLVDADADALSRLSEHAKGRDIVLFNISEQGDELRAGQCSANLMHTIASRSMLTDAMAQFLVASRWHEILVLRGEFPEDAEITTAFQASAKKFGLKITDVRDFVLGNDPRVREKNNIALMTQGVDYDAVFVADSLGEVSRYIPYQTADPRPVVGSEGLVAGMWHWAWERHGAPQLNQRFEKRNERRMLGTDWAAWVAVKAVIEALARSGVTEFSGVHDYLMGGEIVIDGYKGTPSSFRPWDNQLRQPILLHTANAVIARAPIAGFLHKDEYMDTLGYDKAEKRCTF